MTRLADADALLCRALARAADAAGIAVVVTPRAMTRWASATFAGARHEVQLDLPASPACADWLAGLPEADLLLRGQLVADLKIVSTTTGTSALQVVVEVLSVEDR